MIENPYVRTIAELDRLLSMIRKYWLEAKSPAETAKWLQRLNDSLDERLRQMHQRASFEIIAKWNPELAKSFPLLPPAAA